MNFKRFPWMLALVLLPVTVNAQSQYLTRPAQILEGPAELLGAWGTPAQCDAFRQDRYDDLQSYPYEISDQWLKQGWIHCYLSWHGDNPTDGGIEARAFAQCGEDLLREYRLFLTLENEQLRIRWSQDFTTASLQSCDAEH